MTPGPPPHSPGAASLPVSPGRLRFQVLTPGLEIGRFFECDGLELAYDIEEYAEGGSGAGHHRLRGHLRYPNLVLSRGITREDALLEWFLSAESQDERPTVTVALLDDVGSVIRHWAFAEAWPVAWRGPALHAGTSSLATERLEIAHAGLIPTDPATAEGGSAARSPIRGFERARLEIEGGETAVCWFNPRDYSIAQSKHLAPHGGDGEGQFAAPGARVLTLDLLFDEPAGPPRGRVRDTCERLFAAMQPTAGAGGDDPRAPTITFVWGDSMRFRAIARRVGVRYARFRADGTPIRAHVALTLVESEPTRPAHGRVAATAARGSRTGWRGPRTRTLRLGDTLHSIAHDVYGDASKWRLIAEANAIDDPLCLPAFGTVLRLPPPPDDDAEPPISREARDSSSAGAGLAFPLRVDSLGRLALVDGDAAVRDAVRFLLATAPGDAVACPQFGCDLAQFVHEPINGQMTGRVGAEIRDALSRCETRIDVVGVDVAADAGLSGRLNVDISYVLRATGEAGRLVHAFSTSPAEVT